MGDIETGPLVVASTHQLDKYQGRFRLTVDDLEEMALNHLDGSTVFNLQHDPQSPLAAQVIDANVELREDGEFELRVNLRVDEDQWLAFLDELEQRGAPGGLSYTRLIEFAQIGTGPPEIAVAPDAGFYTQDEIIKAAESYHSSVPLQLAELVQFSATEVCQVIVVMQQPESALQIWLPSVVSGLIGPVLIALTKAGQLVRHRLQFRHDGVNSSVLEAVIETEESTVVANAIGQISQLDQVWRSMEYGQLWSFDESSGLWIRR